MNQKHKVSLVQVNFQVGPVELNSFHLPYTVGCLWAYAQAQPDIDSCYELNQLIWRRDPLEQVVDQLKNDAVVGFSTYVWNLQYNLHLAQALKAVNPNCLIIFGGPEPAVSDPKIFCKYPWIDAIIKNEGEITFAEILRNRNCFDAVPGILINRDLQAIDTGQSQRVDDLSILPSPYLSGLFDSLVANNADVKWSATLETNRGCPYQCTFCDWGSLTLSKIKKFTVERVYGELEWMSQNQIDFVMIADANFGIFPDRDREIVERFIELQREYLAPSGIAAAFAKNQNKEVIDIVELLIKKTLRPTTGLKISLQSFNDNTLDAIKRKNLKSNNIAEILKIGREKGVPIGTELIMGLPRETLDTWKNNLWKLLELGMHDDIDIYYCQVLENAELNQVQREVYNIKTTKIYDYFSPTSQENVGLTAESIDVITSTAHMSFDDIVKASVVNWNLFTWHVGGYSNLVTRFLRRYKNVSYQDMYTKLFEQARHHEWYRVLEQQQIDVLCDWFEHGRCTLDSGIPNVKLYGNSIIFHTRMLLSLHPEIAAKWYALLDNFVAEFALEQDLHQDLMDLQQHLIVPLGERNSYPRVRQYQHNLWQYLNDHTSELHKTPTPLEFKFGEPAMSDTEFVERVFWSRRRRFGQATVTQITG
jgi:tRNA A37 methylthiotransferase MiaB